MANVENVPILRSVTTTQIGGPAQLDQNARTFHVTGKVSSGSGTVQVDMLGGNTDDVNEAVLLGTVDLVLSTGPKGEGFVSEAPWRNVWARVNSITGTGAVVSVVAAV